MIRQTSAEGQGGAVVCPRTCGVYRYLYVVSASSFWTHRAVLLYRPRSVDLTGVFQDTPSACQTTRYWLAYNIARFLAGSRRAAKGAVELTTLFLPHPPGPWTHAPA